MIWRIGIWVASLVVIGLVGSWGTALLAAVVSLAVLGLFSLVPGRRLRPPD